MKTWLLNAFTLLFLSTLLSACGGGGGTGSAPVTAANANLTFTAIKNFQFSWTDVADATFYRLLENADGQSGFTQVGSDISPGTQTIDHIVPLYARVNAQYILQSCNATGCTDDTTVSIANNLVDSIGNLTVNIDDEFDFFGNSVSLSADGNTLAVGAAGDDSNTTGVNSVPNDDGSGNNSGAAYVFSRTGTSWTQQAYIKASNTRALDVFGKSVSLSGDGNTLAVGADREDLNINGTPNSVYLF